MRKFVFLVTLAACSHHLACKSLRVINGTEDIDNEFPFVVSLETLVSQVPGYEIYRVCTGSLISSNWALTAAHCLVWNLYIVRYGDVTVPRNQSKYIGVIIKRLRHPAFKRHTLITNDIGLIMAKQVEIDAVGKMSAVDYKTLTGAGVRYAGFGGTRNGDKRNDWKFLETDMIKPLQIGFSVVCNCPRFDHEMEWFPILCIRPRCSDKHQDLSEGDSGGPLFFDGKIVAVTTGGVNGQYSVLTPVSPYLGWIRQTLSSK